MDTYTLRVTWEGNLISEQTGLDYEDGTDEFYSEEKFYLNLPSSHRAQGTTIQLFRESDGWIEAETTF